MLKLNDPKALWSEIKAAEERIFEGYLWDWDDMRLRPAGPDYTARPDKDVRRPHDRPENPAFEWLSGIGPQMSAGDPQIHASGEGSEFSVQAAESLAEECNRWSRRYRLRGLMRQFVSDYGAKYCVALVDTEARGRWTGPKKNRKRERIPWVRRISPKHFLWDALALTPEALTWMGHLEIWQHEELLQEVEDYPERGWDIDAIKGMVFGAGVEQWREGREKSSASIDREEVVLYRLWCKDYVPEDGKQWNGKPWPSEEEGYHGAWICVAVGKDDEASPISHAVPALCMEKGPYEMGGAYVLSDEVAPFSVATASSVQTDYDNAVSAAIIRGIESYSSGLLVSHLAGDLNEIMANLEHQGIASVDLTSDELQRYVMQVTRGGIDAQMLASKEYSRGLVARATGISDNDDPNVSATATAVNAGVTNTRTADQVGNFASFAEGVMLKVAYLYHHDPNLNYEIEVEDERVLLDGGDATLEGAPSLAWEDMHFRIDLLSMTRTTEQSRDAQFMALQNAYSVFCPLVMQFPFVDWDKPLKVAEEVGRIPGFRDSFDLEVARQVAGAMLQAQLEAPQRPQGTPGMSRSGGSKPMAQPQPARAFGNGGAMSGARPAPSGNPLGAPAAPGVNGTPKAGGAY